MTMRWFILIWCVGLALLSSAAAKAQTVTLTPDSIDFGDVALNAGGGHLFGSFIKVQTSGAGTFDLTALGVSHPPYSITLGSCGSNIPGGGSCQTTSVRLDTTVAGVFDDVLTLNFIFHPATGGQAVTVPEMLTLSATVGSVPEPSTWAMALVGFAALGYAGYRNRRQRASVAF